MESRLSVKGLKILSNVVISLFAVVSLGFFLLSIDRTLIIGFISIVMLCASLYLMWAQHEFDSISLLIFFFGTTACFFFFSDIVVASWSQAISIMAFALLNLVLSNYLLNTAKPVHNPEKILYKIALAIIFTEIFWVLSFFKASQLSKGAITAVIFFNLQAIVRDILENKISYKRFAFLVVVSIILLAIVIYRI